jgi:radical SAM superfamily enzyme YgiQ (UPF0313 family)
MKILLISPAAEHLRVTRAGQVSKRAMLRFSVLPLTTVAALTPAGHEVAICDENVEPVPFDSDADLIGISFMTAFAPRAYELAAEFRKRGKLTVAGGYHPTFLPDEVAQHFDAVVVGDAEELWPQVVADAALGRLRRCYRHALPADLAESPPPRHDLLQQTARHYATTGAVQVGRGCAHGCRYCSVTAFHGRTYRVKPLANVLEELRQIGRDMIFVDDNIISDRDYARKLFEVMIPLGKRWVSQCSIEIADDPELLDLAKRAGCIGLFIGLETINQRNLVAVDKKFNAPARMSERIEKIQRAGIGIIAGIIVGMDADERDSFRHTLRFLLQHHIEAVQVNILTPLPGTPLFRDFESAGRITDRDWAHYTFRQVVIQPARMTAADLQAGADWLYRQFYRLDRVLVRCLRVAWRMGPAAAWLAWRLNKTYRFDIRHEHIRGYDPAAPASEPAPEIATQTLPALR